jgi:hypothetical protein
VKKKKKILMVVIPVMVVAGIYIFYRFFLKDFLLQKSINNNFNPEQQITTSQGDKFYYTYNTHKYGIFIGIKEGAEVDYQIYHYEDGKWVEIIVSGGDDIGLRNIKIQNIYNNKEITVYKVDVAVHGVSYNYLMLDKSDNRCYNLSSNIDNAYNMSNKEIRENRILNLAKDFIYDYDLPDDSKYNIYYQTTKDGFDKIKRAFEES